MKQLRSPEDYLNDIFETILGKRMSKEEIIETQTGEDEESKLFKGFLDKLRQAQREAIEAAAEVATVFLPSHPHLHGTKNVDKQSILNLLK